ncbi:MAG: peptidylprolyl isomerase [Pseudomonadales bacterium]|nr:peptidylprolyl isomerase [Pseudomonadales bacterium]
MSFERLAGFVLLGVALQGAGLLGAAPARAAYQELDGIVALVNDDVVLASELLSRLEAVQQQIRASNMQAPPNNVLVSQIMERLIIENLQVQEASRRGVQIDDETLTQAVLSVAQQNGLDLEQFRAALAEDGIDFREFREQIRREMMVSRLQRNLIGRRIAISDKDINDLLNSPYYQQMLSDEYRVGHILLTIDEEGGEQARNDARAAAVDIVTQLRAGADFAQMAIARSSSPRALEGGDLGWRRAAELPSIFSQEVLALKPGDVGDPIETQGGIHIIKLLEVRGASMQTQRQAHVRHILVQPSAIRSEAETEALIRGLYAQLQGGADFAELARQNSQDPGSALAGGDLGWTGGDEFVPEFREALAATPDGALSAPFRTQYGWHVLQVLERREQDMSDEARRNMAARVLYERRFEEELVKWQKELRDEAFVELRI